MDEISWDDCKVAFVDHVVVDAELVWDAWESGQLSLPQGWELCETDYAGARLAIVFRVRVMPTVEDGRRVLKILESYDG